MDLKDIKLVDGTGTDMIDFIFDSKAEELAQINESDKKILNNKLYNIDEKYTEILFLIETIPEDFLNIKTVLIEKLDGYIDLSDEINAYFNSKYYKEGLRNGIELIVEASKY